MSGSRNPNLGITVACPAETAGERWQQNLGQSRIHLGMPRRNDWWTGILPAASPGFSSEDGKLHSMEIPNLATCTRQNVLDYFNNTWTLTELLFSSLIGDEPFYRPPYHGLRHPLIFYYVHPAVLYANKFRVAGLIENPVCPHFESLFETGVDEMSWDDMSKNEIEWPSIDDALKYRAQVYSMVKSIIESHEDLADGHAAILQDHPLWALFMGFEHERIHLETSSVLIRELPVHLVSRPSEWPNHARIKPTEPGFPPRAERDYPLNSAVAVAATAVSYGKDPDWPTYGWDNEYGSRTARLSAFSASQFLISNGEFWQFVAEGGYHQKEHWTETGWQWRSFRNVKAPTFWVPDGPAGTHQYKLRACFEVLPMQWDWPAVVNYHEAKAYCKWKSAKDGVEYRLMTEAEHQAMRHHNQFDNYNESALIPFPPAAPFNTNLSTGSESAVNAETGINSGSGIDSGSVVTPKCHLTPEGALNNESAVSPGSAGVPPASNPASPQKIYDLFGNLWQWCEDHFNPLPGSRVHRYYDDFSTPCYDGQHQMILGGSFASTGDEATPWARFHFRPHFFQHAGFRMIHTPDGSDGSVARIGETTDTSNPYESQDIFNEYMTLHFAPEELQMPHAFGPSAAVSFPQRCADLLTEWCNKLGVRTGRALDVGCAVGGASFKLAESFDQVIGVDLSERFIKAAKELKTQNQLEFNYKIEANIFGKSTARVENETANKTEFRQADACALPAEYMDFDAVLMANLLCRLPSPSACLSRMWGNRGMVKPGGILLTISPYTWMEKFTPSDVWLGGFKDESGKECYSEDGLKRMLGEHFELLHCVDIPLIIREHHRKYQYIVSQAMVWRRK